MHRRNVRLVLLAALASQGLLLLGGCGFAGMSQMMSAMWNWMT